MNNLIHSHKLLSIFTKNSKLFLDIINNWCNGDINYNMSILSIAKLKICIIFKM